MQRDFYLSFHEELTGRSWPIPEPLQWKTCETNSIKTLLSYAFCIVICVSTGHWIGDPCEFCPLSLHVMPTVPSRKLLSLGDKFLRDAQFSFGMTAAFGSCVAQAHNQGEFEIVFVK